MPNTAPDKKPSKWSMALFWFGLVVMLIAFFWFMANHSSSSSAPSKTPTQIGAEAKEAKANDARLDAAIEMVRLVKKNAKDPGSVKFDQIFVNADADLVCASYRAKNSFNAIVRGVAVIYGRTAATDLATWKNRCERAPNLKDYTYTG